MDLFAENEALRRRLIEVEAALRQAEQLTAGAIESAQARLNLLLVNFADAVRPVMEPAIVAGTACRLVAQELGAERAYWAEVDWTTREFVIKADHHAPEASSVSGRFPLDQWQPFSSYHLEGRPVVVHDSRTDTRITSAVRQGYDALGIRADLAVSTWVGGRLRAVLAVNQAAPRVWSHDEVALVRGAADRCWAEIERARAEAALRESQAQLAAAFESVPAAVAVADLDGKVILGNERYRRFLPDGMVPSRNSEGQQCWRAWTPDGQPIAAEDWPGARALRGEHVTPGLDILYTDPTGHKIWTNVAAAPVEDSAGRVTGCVSVISDITERKLTEAALRDSEERQMFLLSVTDALRPLADPIEIQRVATSALGNYLGASRVFYVLVEKDDDAAVIEGEYTNGVPSRMGRYRLSEFSSSGLDDWRAGRVGSTDDVEGDPRYGTAERLAYASVQTRAGFGVPLIKNDRLVSILGVNQSTPRHWTRQEIDLTKDIADRTWAAVERARAEAALRDSEARFHQFADASASVLWIRDAATLSMEYVSQAAAPIYGVKPDDLLGDLRRWAALIVPDDRDAALAGIERVRAGETISHEFRIQRPSDKAFRWVRNTGFPLLDASGCVERIGGIFEDVTAARLAVEHQNVLLAELQHRVRNIMAMIRSIALRSADGAVDVANYRSLLDGRLTALARVQVLLTREANAGAALRDIIVNELAAQAHHSGQFELAGPDVHLAPKAVEVITLAIHELATNALKYGAFSIAEGRLRVSWSTFDQKNQSWLALNWIESSVPPRAPSKHRGFGSDLVEARIPYELGGSGKITLGAEGAQCRIEIPLESGESILETDAPGSTSIFGGTLDMTEGPDLSGRNILVVEDDYYLASDTAVALRGAGAEVLGPCPNKNVTLQLLAAQTPTHAVVDLNLGGGGPEFDIATVLADRGVPTIFITGYDPDVIPAEFKDVPRLQKPVSFAEIIEAVSRL